MKRDFLERFWSKVNEQSPNECWPWTGSINSHGYGQFAIYRGKSRKWVYAHRLSYELSTAESIDGKVIRHSCDNPPCVNPEHLQPGTQAQNVRDAIDRGRSVPPPIHYGSSHHHARLTEECVRKIRQRYAAGGITQTALAVEFGISQTVISDLIRHKIWAHVQEAK